MLEVGRRFVFHTYIVTNFLLRPETFIAADVHQIFIHIQKTNMTKQVYVGSTEDINFLFVVISC